MPCYAFGLVGYKIKIMREIKFRGISKENNKWVFGFYGISAYCSQGTDFTIHPEVRTSIRIEGNTLGQYSGLKDKEGKEIYEGDILTDKDKNTTIVVWIDEWAMFGCMFHDEWELYRLKGVKEIDESMFWTFPIENNQLEVIGNIHENADLFSERSVKADA